MLKLELLQKWNLFCCMNAVATPCHISIFRIWPLNWGLFDLFYCLMWRSTYLVNTNRAANGTSLGPFQPGLDSNKTLSRLPMQLCAYMYQLICSVRNTGGALWQRINLVVQQSKAPSAGAIDGSLLARLFTCITWFPWHWPNLQELC